MEQLKVSIKPKFEPVNGQMLNSSGYSVKINDWKLGRGVTDFTLEMPAGKKPKATITFNPDIVDIEVTAASIQTLVNENDECTDEVRYFCSGEPVKIDE
ncbi:hypothetical protein [Streptococcus hyointestinalis]|nr:hypothetical protein [Streptococcus hyointestinalis]